MNSSNKLLAAILVLQVLILLGQWVGSPAVLSVAEAQVPDAGSQRIQIIQELKSLNAKMDKLVDVLQDGVLQVRVTPPDEGKRTAPAK